jgi:hypothetical protein
MKLMNKAMNNTKNRWSTYYMCCYK